MIREEIKHHMPRIGMRSIKTVLAVFLCCFIGYFRGVVPMQSTIAAILCIQPDTENTMNTAATRSIGTLLGGFIGAVVLIALDRADIAPLSPGFYLIICALLLPLIYIPVRLGWPSATALTCIVFLVVALSHTPDTPPLEVATERMIDTLIGILVALPVNLFLPKKPVPDIGEEIAALRLEEDPPANGQTPL